jgi:DNA polymerase-4
MRTVIHWDGDRFFASIEQAADQRLRQKPVAIGGPARGVILSASAEARKFGIRPGMATARARRALPTLIVIPAHFDLYERFFDQILGLCRETTPLVEPSTVGAAWLDLTGAERVNHSDAPHVVARIRSTVHDWLRVSISAGIATNKMVARVAARLRKPASQIVVPPGRERAFLAPLPLAWLPGLDRNALSAFEVAGLRTIGQFAQAPIDALASVTGRMALPLVRRAQGVSEEPVAPRRPRQTEGFRESAEFSEDVWEEPVLLAHLRRLLEQLMAQVRAASVEIRRLTLELRYTDREENRRSLDLQEPTALDTDLLPRLPLLLETTWTRRVRLRALTLHAARVYRPSPQLDLFSTTAPQRQQHLQLATAIDRLRLRHGAAIIRRAGDLPLSESA